MNSWSETITLPKPLRDVHLASPESPASPGAQPSQDTWRAGYETGRIDGEKALSEQLLKQRAETNELFQGLLTSLRQAVPQVVRDTESMMVSLALEVAQKLVANMPISAPMLEAAVRDALGEVEGTAQITIRLHPADLELLKKTHSPLMKPGDSGNDFRFLGSPEVTRGGCLVQTRFGTVDARRETKFDLLKRNLVP
ncbi:MAG TPA: FliH/SctL family protein [Candidatus Baltobacteraceae bacterium]|jgi:flagellar assembly protein FliH|nr:FliH/SctL family protein [Candidatus Baltobacteraceae bacterium]